MMIGNQNLTDTGKKKVAKLIFLNKFMHFFLSLKNNSVINRLMLVFTLKLSIFLQIDCRIEMFFFNVPSGPMLFIIIIFFIVLLGIFRELKECCR